MPQKLLMRIVLLVLSFLILGNTPIAQAFQIGHITATFIDSSRSNRAVATEIYYPADVTGDNVPFSASITGKVPAISFGHGFVMTYDAYFNVRDAVVPQGYIIAFPKTEGSFSPSHNDFGKDLAFVLKALAKLGNTSSSVLYNKVDTMNCVMGHSMGGGAAFIAAASDNTIKSIATLAAAETTPSAISAASTIAAPGLVFAGINDCVTPPATNQSLMYRNLVSSCKHYIGIKGGSHCQMAEASTTCSFGEATCTPTPTISRAFQHAVIDTYLIPWLNYYLKQDCASGHRFDTKLLADTSINYLKSCSLCTSGGITNNNNIATATIAPNPFHNELHISLPQGKTYTLTILSITGTEVYHAEVSDDTKLSMSHIPTGVYVYQIVGIEGSLKGVIVKE